jgi:aspartate carbamoyltransferase regulatory subunit
LTKRKEKLLDKFVKRDYNNDLEEILAKKHFKEEVKNLLLDSLYKTENAYKDYETVKKNVPTIDEYIKNVIQCVKKRCDDIELTKPRY